MNTKEFLLTAWNWRPAVLASCALGVAGYAVICRFARKQSPGGSTGPPASAVIYFACGVALFLLTLVSPLDALADGYLFSAHMLQHLLLLLVIPPLLVLAWPRRLGKQSPGPAPLKGKTLRALAGWAGGVGAMWVWHAPRLCNAATGIPAVHAVQIVTLLGLGGLFCWPILGPTPSRRLSPLAGVAYLFTACVGCTLLGIIITFAPVSVCPVYLHPVDRLGLVPLLRNGWGLTPALDQQVGGLIMWVPACLIYLAGIMALLARWYAAPESGQPASVAGAAQPSPS